MFEKPKSKFCSIERLAESQKQEILEWARQNAKHFPSVQEQITDIELALVEIYEVMLDG